MIVGARRQELIVRAWVEFLMAESGAQPGSDSVRPFAGRLPHLPHLAHPCRIHRKTVNLHAGDDWEQPPLQLKDPGQPGGLQLLQKTFSCAPGSALRRA